MSGEYPPGWDERDGAIERSFEFPSYMDGIAFVQQVAQLAEEANHHPDIAIGYRVVTIRLWTHSEQAITARDVDLAASVNELAP